MTRKKRHPVHKCEQEIISGVLHLHPRGFGFVVPDHRINCPKDVFIPRHLTDHAVDGDRVQVALAPEILWEKGPEGKIVSILQRTRTHLAGTVCSLDARHNAIVYVPLLGASKPALVKASESEPLRRGDRIIMEVTEWGAGAQEGPICTLSHRIGHISDPSCDIQAAIKEFDLRDTFSPAAIDQARHFGQEVSGADLKERRDFSELATCTIDPETAEDFDDALSLTKDADGTYHLAVHIADVAHYVKPSTPLDVEAKLRCNSTYFPNFCLPMLPKELSSHLCSLRPDVLRLTISVLMDFDPSGQLLRHQIVRSYIKSQKRFTYEEAKEVLDGERKSPFAKTLQLMVELCHLLKKKRAARGSIDFTLPEQVILVDEKGVPIGLKRVEYDITHQLVEEFMLKANEVVAQHLTAQGRPPLYRVHEQPSEEDFTDFYALARLLGFTLPKKPTQQDLQQLFEQAKHNHLGAQLSVAFIRSMKLATYSPNNVGHYGLALEHYCHFTSPIRRYTDLVSERLLFEGNMCDDELSQIALKCSEDERISFKAEMSVKTLKKLRLLQQLLEANPHQVYPAIITRAKGVGIYFELCDLMLDGFIHISELADAYFDFVPETQTLVSRGARLTYGIGKPIQVQLCSVDLILLEAKWILRHATQSKKSGQKRGRQRRRR